MLGIVFLFVGAVLLHLGVCRLVRADGRTSSTVCIMGGAVLFVLYIFMTYRGFYLSGGVGLLVAVLYIYIGITELFNLSIKPLGWYALLVAASMIPMMILDVVNGDTAMAILWLMWIVLLTSMWLEEALGKNLKNAVPYMCIFMAPVTGIIPGYVLMIDVWPYFGILGF